MLDERNREALRAAGVCIWLQASAEELHRRTQCDPGTTTGRPPLTELEPLDEVQHLLNQRAALYAAVADHVVETTGRTVMEVVDAVLALLRGRRTSSESC